VERELGHFQAQIAFDLHDCEYFKTSPKLSHDPR
jgi:hypothetical protein